MSWWEGRSVLVTGGTGSLGHALTEALLREPVRAIRIFSRDEFKQSEMGARFTDARMRFFIGDVRDRDRVRTAARGADVLIHAAALKRADAIEYNAVEAVRTNITGSENIVSAAIEEHVAHACLISSDKAMRPTFIYGATKMIAEQLFLHPYSGAEGPVFSVARLGNLIGSRGSIVPILMAQRDSGEVTITDPRCTRYVLGVAEAARFIIDLIERECGGVASPEMRALRLSDLVAAVAPGARVKRIGLRKGEKLHEQLNDAGDESCDGLMMTVSEIRDLIGV